MAKDPKKRHYCAALLIGLTFFILFHWALPSQPLTKEAFDATSLEGAFIDVANKVRPSVVSIFSERTVSFSPWEGFGEDFFRGSPFEEFFKGFGRPRREYRQKQRGTGSGVIIDKSGNIITNHHVVADADKITVRLYDGREFDGTTKGNDPKTDLAVVHIKGENLKPATLGDSDKLRVGQWAVAIGSPFGLEETVTVGVVSATGRSGFGTGTYEDFIQTDASINPGNSGGALCNIRGEVIGINAMIIQPGHGIGFAIPINLAKSISHQLIKRGKVIRAWIGIGIQDLTQELRKQFELSNKEGVLINKIFPNSPAERADLKIGDIVKEIDGQMVRNSKELVQQVLKKEVGQEVTLNIIRNGKEMTIPIETEEMASEITAEAETPEVKKGWFGLKVEEITPQMVQRWGITVDRGVVIVEVEPGSSGHNAGLQPGDVILEVNRKKIEDTKDYQRAMQRANRRERVLLLINREGGNIFVILQEG
ncbi:MAG: Do family serine endopeptidase [Syntrophobacterales bacterium]|nr:MAG: Do family serine endopeptidase [Syntrophobacterales bacterium]